uniref:Uncharacterized protein AlNc14C374G11147 n=1 Tax=Albugo laibachii Nc14 TaxID=890382 RepID=F0WY87_9STRA|nr:conserved hypothetical protein [Albugo laibachii Nc14]|eukprot:CCA26439.1 conserved hypothetical protein [Albugo laibachii Nc14]
MGSSLTVINDTRYKWLCQVSTDDQSLKIALSVTGAIGLFFSTLGLAGAFSPILTGLRPRAGVDPALFVAPSMMAGMTSESFLQIAKVVEISGAFIGASIGIINFGMITQRTLEDGLLHRQFVKLKAGESHLWRHMSPLLLRQAVCVRTYNFNETVVRTETLTMRPLFTGIPGKPNFNYKLTKYYNRKKFVRVEDIIAKVDANDAEATPMKSAPTIIGTILPSGNASNESITALRPGLAIRVIQPNQTNVTGTVRR